MFERSAQREKERERELKIYVNDKITYNIMSDYMFHYYV